MFTQEIRDVFFQTGDLTDLTLLLTELFSDTVITTNYDRLIEQAYDTGAEDAFQIINGVNALEKPDPHRVSIIKLHGDITDPARCILSKNQYDEAYGKDTIDLTLPIPRLLEYFYRNSILLFLGCSLNEDRTVETFRAIKAGIGDFVLPQHFAIEQAPVEEDDLVNRNALLASLGITGIWFEEGQFNYVEDMLRLARNELSYRGIVLGEKSKADSDKDEAIEEKSGFMGRLHRLLFG